MKLILDVYQEGYTAEKCEGSTITVREFIAYLEEYEGDTLVYTRQYGRNYSYGTIRRCNLIKERSKSED